MSGKVKKTEPMSFKMSIKVGSSVIVSVLDDKAKGNLRYLGLIKARLWIVKSMFLGLNSNEL